MRHDRLREQETRAIHTKMHLLLRVQTEIKCSSSELAPIKTKHD